MHTWRGEGVTRLAEARNLGVGGAEGEFDEVRRELVDAFVEGVAKGEVLKGEGKGCDVLVERIADREAGELGRELVHGVVEGVAEGEALEIWWERVYVLVERIAYREIAKRDREGLNLLVKCVAERKSDEAVRKRGDGLIEVTS